MFNLSKKSYFDDRHCQNSNRYLGFLEWFGFCILEHQIIEYIRIIFLAEHNPRVIYKTIIYSTIVHIP